MPSDKIYNSITDTTGRTPLVRLNRLAEGCVAEVLVKCEFMNPLSSVKDRIALSMIEAAETAGDITPETMLVEPTSGNTGIALAFVCAAKGYKLTIVMPDSMSIERRKMLTHLGAILELTPAAGGMKAAIARAQEIVAAHPNAKMLQQFENPFNPMVHERTTAEEIWADTAGKIDCFIAGVGTGGTITGVGNVLKERKADVQIIAVEPADSPMLSQGTSGKHKIQGIGAGFIPPVLKREVIDEVITVSNEDAFATARAAAKQDGLPVGISSGATLCAALQVAKRPAMKGKRIVVIAASSADRYISTELFV